MKEININIEGYNVNGICVGCLNYNRKMFYCNEVTECFRLVADIDVPDGLTIQVCWECLAYVRTIKRFQKQILDSYEVLINYSNKHKFLNSVDDFKSYAHQRLLVSSIDTSSEYPVPFDCDKWKMQIDIDVKDEVENVDENLGYTSPKLDPDYSQDTFEYTADLQYNEDQNISSDDDIQLSKLKKKGKKDKRNKRREGKKEKFIKSEDTKDHKKSRKLRNLPEELVEMFTMTEDEMWEMRAQDVLQDVFVKLKHRCNDCIIGFNTEKLMNVHMNGKHKPKSESSHQCDVCKAYFLTNDNLSTHRGLHLLAYRCKRCNFTSALKSVMLQHAGMHRTIEALQCPICNKSFSTKSRLIYHRGVCNQERPQCDCCGKVFANKMTLKYHLKLQPANKDDKPKEKLFLPCNGCSKVFHSKKSYRAHVVIHEGVTYPCSICGKPFQWKRNLARHMRNHRERAAGALYECRQCGKSFSSRDCYTNHMRLSKRHVPEDSYHHACTYCGKKFATKWCMVDHIDWDHLKRIKYQCHVCFKAFKTAKIMVAHMNNLHEGKRNKEPDGEHLCEICGKSYKTVKRLKGHVWAMHTNRSTTKSFKCKLCPATFTWQTSIYKHMKMMHENKRSKPRALPPVKKQEPYPELANHLQYYQQNIATNIQDMAVQPTKIEIVHNIV